VQWNSMRSKVHPGGGATHQLQDISGITAPLHTPIANALGQRKLVRGCTAKDIQVTEVFVLRCECMGALTEYHWDAKCNTYGSLLIRIGEGDDIGGTGIGLDIPPCLRWCLRQIGSGCCVCGYL
jgi:hypothetical protein